MVECSGVCEINAWHVCALTIGQNSLEEVKPGATVIPVIISSDKTQLTLFRNKSAYPVYMTIGNIPKDVRKKPSKHAQVLLGYLPTSRLDHIKNKAARRRALANLFHECMRRILCPIKDLGETGVAMMSGDGVWCRCHPIFATFVGDYPEQCLVACTLYGDCPKCPVPHHELGENEEYMSRDPEDIQHILELADADPVIYNSSRREVHIRPVYHPFWEGFPYTNIFIAITPDILHQMYQGVMKHLISWCAEAFGPNEIDARCRMMPPNHHLRLFTKGITTLSRVSGKEHRDMCCILLGLLVDLPLPDSRSPVRVIRAVRSLLDFLYLAQYPSHTTHTLTRLNDALASFHDNKHIFIELGVREHFEIPKLHSLTHYSESIKLFGTTDNYNTEQSERLHIDFTKDAYRALNRKDEYSQMTTWLERREKVQHHHLFVNWRLAGQPTMSSNDPIQNPLHVHIKMTKHPSRKAVTLDALTLEYGAIDFADALADFVIHHNNPELPAAAARRAANNLLIPIQKVSVFHKMKFWIHDALKRQDKADFLDTVHARPTRQDKRGRPVPGRFDTILVDEGEGVAHGVQGVIHVCLFVNSTYISIGYRVAQVRVVFQLSASVMSELFDFGKGAPPEHLAYVEWFSRFPGAPESDSGMYRVTRSIRNGRRNASIIPVASVRRSIHLFPRFGPVAPRHWSSFNVLEECSTFYVNPWTDRHTYITVF